LQGTGCYEGAAKALRHVKKRGLRQGLLADGQCFTVLQLQRAVIKQRDKYPLDQLLDADLHVLSFEQKARKPSERPFRHLLEQLEKEGIAPAQVLHVGSRIPQDIAPARKLGMRTALFAGDKGSLQATPEQLKDPAVRPDAMLTELLQIREIIP
jgi:FMN phosphatase YigB (HAD superfamily)